MTLVSGGIAGDALRSYIERIERLSEEKQNLTDDIKDIYSEAKSTGFDTKIIKIIIKRRKFAKSDLDEQEALLEVYEHALANTPIEKAISKATAIDTSVTLN